MPECHCFCYKTELQLDIYSTIPRSLHKILFCFSSSYGRNICRYRVFSTVHYKPLFLSKCFFFLWLYIKHMVHLLYFTSEIKQSFIYYRNTVLNKILAAITPIKTFKESFFLRVILNFKFTETLDNLNSHYISRAVG